MKMVVNRSRLNTCKIFFSNHFEFIQLLKRYFSKRPTCYSNMRCIQYKSNNTALYSKHLTLKFYNKYKIYNNKVNRERYSSRLIPFREKNTLLNIEWAFDANTKQIKKFWIVPCKHVNIGTYDKFIFNIIF